MDWLPEKIIQDFTMVLNIENLQCLELSHYK